MELHTKTFPIALKVSLQESLKQRETGMEYAALQELQQGIVLQGTARQTLEQFLTDWIENSQKQYVRARTYERYEEIVRLHIVPVLGRHRLQKLPAQHVQAFYAKKLNEGLSATTVGVFHNVLHKALATAVKWGLIPRNVCDLVSPPHAEGFEIKPLTVDQAHLLLAATHGHRLEALFTLALATGMRRGELCHWTRYSHITILLANCQSGIGKEYEILNKEQSIDETGGSPCPCIHTQSQLFQKKQLV